MIDITVSKLLIT